MSRPPRSADPKRETCDELAERLATPEGLRTARLLQAAGLLGPVPEAMPPRPSRRPPEPISLWEPRQTEEGLVFVRPDPLPLGDHFAAVKTLRPKRSELPLRVCFFGESAAAGYLYAPHLTPAQVLEGQLRAAGGGANFEVVDLARTNETLPTLRATVRSSLQINPDVLVLFAGNNWNLLETPEVSPYVPSVRARQRYAQALREGGLQGPVREAERQLRETAEETLGFIADLAEAVGIPVVLVIPEVNLADWETRQPVPWLPAGGTALWYALYEDAVRHLDRGAWDEAEASAREMLDLDGGACPTAHRVLARAYRGRGDLEAARQAALAEIDAAPYAHLAFLSAPQATTLARDLLREGARRHGFATVDLREVFAAHTGSPLPGRRLFLDYCHLTAEGMQVAMAAVAAQVLNLSGMQEEEIAWPALLAALPAPRVPPEVEATARFGAAIHSAHRLLSVGSKPALLEHWCEAALEASPGVEEAMLDLIAARCAPCPAVLTAAQQRNLASPYRLLLQHGWQWDFLDADVIEAIATVLERRGRPVREAVTRQLLEHHAIRPEGTELAVPAFFHGEPLERFYPEVMSFEDLARRATYRSPWPESSFCLVCDGGDGRDGRDGRDGVELALTARLPAIEGVAEERTGTVEVRVNGTRLGSIDLTGRWTSHALVLDRQLLRPGLNRVVLRWPPAPAVGEAALRSAIERLEIGLAADLHPVFGEVFSLVARPC